MLLSLSVICGVSAVVGVMRWRSQMTPAAAPVETVDVIVAAVELFPNDQLSRELLAVKKWPKELVPAGAVTNPDEVADQYSTAQVAQGEPIFKSRLSRQPVGLMAKISPGKRAISVLTPKFSSSVAGLLLPGQHVDVLLTHKLRSPGGTAETLLQNILVLAVDRRIQAQADGKDQGDQQLVQSVTLEVAPHQAERLSGAQLDGEISLILRGPEDKEVLEVSTDVRSAEQEDLLVTAVDDLQKSTAAAISLQKATAAAMNQTNSALAGLQEMFTELSAKLAEESAEKEKQVAAETSDAGADEVSGPLDVPVFTLRGNVWGYVMSRQPVPQSPYRRDGAAPPTTRF